MKKVFLFILVATFIFSIAYSESDSEKNTLNEVKKLTAQKEYSKPLDF